MSWRGGARKALPYSADDGGAQDGAGQVTCALGAWDLDEFQDDRRGEMLCCPTGKSRQM
jgi:hypothetical protein